nr:undecaprenyldiphospho-muramoylpentapeptide beta-N-acetylglucosaminyltransferase [Thiomicrorhabdus cannonii]
MKVMIMAGGTGGHVFPGIAIAEALYQQQVNVVWLGTQGGMEKEWVEKAGLPFHAISIKGLRGNGLLGWLKAPVNVTRAWWQARKIMRAERPDLVLGMGGFVCGPGGLAAKTLGIPLVIHEQNAIPGLTNKLLAPLAREVICAFPQTVLQGNNVVTLGNPVRAGLEDVALLQPQTGCHVLVLGGSRGALALNETVPKALALLPPEQRPSVTHQTGVKTLQQAQQAYAQAGVAAEVVAFIDDMRSAYEKADMVVSRAGALTVSELMATARPAIMVPYPQAVDDHQTANAQALVTLGGGEVIQQSDLTPQRLAAALGGWCADPQRRVAASHRIRQGAPKDVTGEIAARLLALMPSKQCEQ